MNTAKYFLLITGFFPLKLMAASSPCVENGVEIGRIQLKSKFAIACGNKEKENVTTVSSVQIVEGKKSKSLFEADEAFKSYVFSSNDKSFFIKESLNLKGSKPFLEIQIVCEKNDCQKIEKCIWKKEKPNENVVNKVEAESKKQSPNVSDVDIDHLFIAALNGSERAQKILSANAGFPGASASEAFATYKEDIPRLKKISCL